MIWEIIASTASGTFFGAAVYINLVEHPARFSCGTELAVREWRPSYRRATLMQAPLAIVGASAAFISWWIDRRLSLLVGGVLLLLVVPFTLIVILPTNKRLENQGLDFHSNEAGDLLRRWNRLHAVRSILSGAAFLLFLVALGDG